MAKRIYVVGEERKLLPMDESPYEAESILQELFERHPDVLAGTQADAPDGRPVRWLLIKREMAVPDELGGAGRWSLDHLFLDRDGVLTLVEVKRATDTRARREVVAQMLDYAANAVLYWPVESIISSFQASAEEAGEDSDQLLSDFLGHDDVDEFWSRVKTNLAAERIRLVFVADEISRELKRIVEFLNGQMEQAEVIAIEVKQYLGQGIKAVVPTLIGQTAKATGKTSTTSAGPGISWTPQTFDRNANELSGRDVAEVFRKIVVLFEASGAGIRWGKGKLHATFTARALVHSVNTEILRVFANGSVSVAMARLPTEQLREDVRTRLNAIPSFADGETTDFWDGNAKALIDAAKWKVFEDAVKALLSGIAKVAAE